MNKILLIVILLALAVAGYVAFSGKLPFTDNRPIVELTQKEKERIAFSSKIDETTAPEDEARYYQAVRALATTTSEIVFDSCVPTPKVFNATTDTFVARNAGESPVTLVFGPEKLFIMEPGQSLTISGIFENGKGIYGYGCGDKRGPAGFIFKAL